MTLDLDELERLEREATPGPWKHWDADGVAWDDPKACGYDSRENGRGAPYYCTGPRTESDTQAGRDAALIAAARNALPELLAEVRKLRLAVNAWAGDMRALAADCGQAGDECPRGAVERELRALRERAQALEEERDRARNDLYALVNAAPAEVIREIMDTDVADSIIQVERDRLNYYHRQLRALRAVAEAAEIFRCFHDEDKRPCGAALDSALDAWRRLR